MDAFDVVLGVTGFAALVTCVGLFTARNVEGYYVNRFEIMAIAVAWIAAAVISHKMMVG
jgi:hypothetical protein